MAWMPTIYILAVLFVASSNGQRISPSQIAGEAGTNVTINCTSSRDGEAENNALQIYNSSTRIFDRFVSSRLLRVSDIGSITIYVYGPLEPRDNGLILTCISNRIQSNNATVIVTFRAIITPIQNVIQDNLVIRRKGQALSISFNVTANPPPLSTDFSWSRNGVPVSSGNGLTLTQDSFITNPTEEEHNGTYSLKVTNLAGPGYYNFTLIVEYPPRFQADFVSPSSVSSTVRSDTIILASTAERSLTLLCGVQGNPPPNVTHSFPEGSPVPSGDNFVINPVTTSSAGNYTCIAYSERFPENIRYRRFQLFVGGPPMPLRRVTPSIDTINRQVEFTWVYNNSVNGVPASNFSLTIMLNGQPIFTRTVEARPLSNTYQYSVPFSDLMGEQMYEVNVMVRNLQGESESIAQIFTTPRSSGVVTYASCFLSVIIVMTAVMLMQ